MLKFIATINIHCYDTRSYTREFTHVMDAKKWVDSWHDYLSKAHSVGEFLNYNIIPVKKARLA